MSEEQIRFMLTSVRHQAFLADNVTKVVADEGASDAVCRQLLNARRTSGQPLTINIPDDTLGEDDALNAFHNAQQCIIGMQDDMDSTYLILKHWFPWIIISDKQHSKVNAGGRPDDAADVLNAHVIRAILSVNTCDALLYHKARERFWQQVEFLTQYRGNV